MVYETEIDEWLAAAQKESVFDRIHLSRCLHTASLEALLYPLSIHHQDTATYALLKLKQHDALGIFSTGNHPDGFHGIKKSVAPHSVLFCQLTHGNADTLRKYLPFTAPAPIGAKDITFGVGDRLGIATPGHIRLFKQYRAAPVLAQQSVREIRLTDRSFGDVLDAATWAVLQEGYRQPWGADADHLKEEKQAREVLSLGYAMLTADVSDYIQEKYVRASGSVVASSYEKLPAQKRKLFEARYLNRAVKLESGLRISFSKDDLARLVLTYKGALEHARKLYQAGIQIKGKDQFDFELSIDEVSIPTTTKAHLFIALELLRYRIRVMSVAPRFVGEFQKGIDYIGSIQEFQDSLRIHANIAKTFGYKLSLHSGSDKFLVFSTLGRETEGKFHIKTSGTNWLEALKMVSEKDPPLFRAAYELSLEKFKEAQKYYHVNPDMSTLPILSDLEDVQLSRIFGIPSVRQLLHITYGELLQDPKLKRKLYKTLHDCKEHYYIALVKHIGKHLDLLGVPKTAPAAG